MLAFQGSKLADAIERDPFKTTVEMDYSDLISDGALDLQALWDMLEQQQGFDPKLAEPMMCALKTWEPRFGHEVRLPEHLAGIEARDLALKAATLSVPAGKLQHLFAAAPDQLHTPSTKRAAAATARSRSDSLGMSAVTPTGRAVKTKLTWRERREVGIIAVVLTLAALGFVGYQMTLAGKDGGWERFDVAQHTDIKLEGVERLGKQVSATLVDEAWMSTPAAKRIEQMESALRSMYTDEIEVFYVKDGKGRVRAIAQWWGNPPQIRVTFK